MNKSSLYEIKEYYWLVLLFCVLIGFQNCKNKKQESSPSSAFRLISYNVWYGFTKQPERKKQWLDWMKKQNPDVVSLQELNEYTPEKLSSDAEYRGHSYSVILKEDGFPTGITSRFPIKAIQCKKDGFHHGLLRVIIEDIYFYVIHLHPETTQLLSDHLPVIVDFKMKIVKTSTNTFREKRDFTLVF